MRKTRKFNSGVGVMNKKGLIQLIKKVPISNIIIIVLILIIVIITLLP
jgi:hypothetical protein